MSGNGSEATQASYKKPIQKPNVKRINIGLQHTLEQIVFSYCWPSLEVITEKTQGNSNDDSQEVGRDLEYFQISGSYCERCILT